MPSVRHIEKGAMIVMESRPYHGNQRGAPRTEEVEVVKVGRDFIYVQRAGRTRSHTLKFRRDTGEGLNDEHSSGCRLFDSFEAYGKHAERGSAIRLVTKLMDGGTAIFPSRKWDNLTDEDMNTLTTLLKKLNGETP